MNLEKVNYLGYYCKNLLFPKRSHSIIIGMAGGEPKGPRFPRSRTFFTPQIPRGIKFITSWFLEVLAKIP